MKQMKKISAEIKDYPAATSVLGCSRSELSTTPLIALDLSKTPEQRNSQRLAHRDKG